MIAGLEDITDGELRIGGKVVNDKAPKDRDIAMVFQSYALYPHMTVRENMGFALKLAKTPKNVIDEKVNEAARVLDLTQHLDRRPANLSGGQRQRVAMGRAIVRDPAAFLMDEPLSNLDAKLRVQTRTEVSRLQKRLGTTMVYVTHDQTEAMTLGDRVAVMRSGRSCSRSASPQELYDQPVNLFVAGFIGSPAMNFMAGTLEEGKLRTGLGDFPLTPQMRRTLESAGAAREVIVGIRPEELRGRALSSGRDQAEGLEFHADHRRGRVDGLGRVRLLHPGDSGRPRTPPSWRNWPRTPAAAELRRRRETVAARLDPATTDQARARTPSSGPTCRSMHIFDRQTGENLTQATTDGAACPRHAAGHGHTVVPPSPRPLAGASGSPPLCGAWPSCDDLVVPLVGAHQPVALARHPLVGLGLGARRRRVGRAEHAHDRRVLLGEPPPGDLARGRRNRRSCCMAAGSPRPRPPRPARRTTSGSVT